MSVRSKQVSKSPNFPMLMLYDLCGDSYVVLMNAHGIGMVVSTNTTEHPIGDYRENWLMEASGHIYFVPSPCKVVIENE